MYTYDGAEVYTGSSFSARVDFVGGGAAARGFIADPKRINRHWKSKSRMHLLGEKASLLNRA